MFSDKILTGCGFSHSLSGNGNRTSKSQESQNSVVRMNPIQANNNISKLRVPLLCLPPPHAVLRCTAGLWAAGAGAMERRQESTPAPRPLLPPWTAALFAPRVGCFALLRGQVALCFLAQGMAKANPVKGTFQSRIHLNGQSGLLHSWSNPLWPRTMGGVSVGRAAVGANATGLCAGHRNLTEK